MSDSLEVALRSVTVNQPRARLGGLPTREIDNLQARMPSLIDVRKEAKLGKVTRDLLCERAANALELLKKPPPDDCEGVDQSGEKLGILHPSVAYHIMLPKLHVFSYFCHEQDVPDDLLFLCMWALQHKLSALLEAPDKQLRRMLEGPSGKIVSGAKTFMEGQTRAKLINHLISSRINRPEEAISHIEACMKLDEKTKPEPNDSFLRNPMMYILYGSVLTCMKTRDSEAQVVLEKVLRDIDKVEENNVKLIFIQAKLHLSRVLRRTGNVTAASEHESYLINWFRKNPQRIEENTLRDWFRNDTDNDPILQGLGGMVWLENRKPTFKTLDRRSRVCYNCGKRETPTLKLARCGKCQYTYYCSRKCQVENHPYHKIGCAERAADIKRAEALKTLAPDDSKCIEDWGRYKSSGVDEVTIYHALGLKFDLNRGKTHIMFKRVIYIPDGGKDILDRFRVIQAGVFKVSDVIKEMDGIMGYNPGETREAMDEMIDEFNHGPGKSGKSISFFTLYITDDTRMKGYLSIGGVSIKFVKGMRYDPDWRKLMNRSKFPAEPLLLRSGVQDAEHDYTPGERMAPETNQTAHDFSKYGSDSEDPNSDEENAKDNNIPSGPTKQFVPAAALPGLRGLFNKK
ncbi:hypothetical protein VNI00_011827 [Paramarasmius palmivorus]|uniref:MYND-type domain-containing protein n=1 Tax=Paramarasmius palmivorus TaxID=297713 RepID=A0AAW0CAK4_9AGAR